MVVAFMASDNPIVPRVGAGAGWQMAIRMENLSIRATAFIQSSANDLRRRPRKPRILRFRVHTRQEHAHRNFPPEIIAQIL